MTTSKLVDWSKLHHAYGDAGDVPNLLQQIKSFPIEANWQAEPWYSLWSALYHQGDIYPASIAAVTEIVDTLYGSPGRATLSFYLLPIRIAIADHASPVEVPVAIRAGFTKALLALGHIAASAPTSAGDEDMAVAVRAAVLVSRGDFQSAGALLEEEN